MGEVEFCGQSCVFEIAWVSEGEWGGWLLSKSVLEYIARCLCKGGGGILWRFDLWDGWVSLLGEVGAGKGRSQWRSHWGGKGGAECHPWQWKNAKNRENSGKSGKKSGKIGKNQEEKAKTGKFLSLCPSWQLGLATLLREVLSVLGSVFVNIYHFKIL